MILGCIECSEMQTIVTDVRGVCPSVCLSVTNAARLHCVCRGGVTGGGACSVRRVPCARGYSVKPLPNAFGFLLYLLGSIECI